MFSQSKFKTSLDKPCGPWCWWHLKTLKLSIFFKTCSASSRAPKGILLWPLQQFSYGKLYVKFLSIAFWKTHYAREILYPICWVYAERLFLAPKTKQVSSSGCWVMEVAWLIECLSSVMKITLEWQSLCLSWESTGLLQSWAANHHKQSCTLTCSANQAL